ncbi:MAG: OmpA family protein [Asticcacaulis sp.]
MSGLSCLALLCAGGLYLTLPKIEYDVQRQVNNTLRAKGLADVKADVSGRSVTLSPVQPGPEAAPHLAQAKAALLAIHESAPHLPGGHFINGMIDQVAIVDPPAAGRPVNMATTLAAMPGGSSPAGAAPGLVPPEIGGEKATTIASNSADTPPVAGDSALQASDAVALNSDAQACQAQIDQAMGSRRLGFVTGTYQLAPEAQGVLDDVYRAIETCPQGLKVTVAGYTDNAGDANAKEIISKTRAEAAADALVRRGLAASRVSAEGYGAASPIADNSTPQGRMLNQRLVIRVSAE